MPAPCTSSPASHRWCGSDKKIHSVKAIGTTKRGREEVRATSFMTLRYPVHHAASAGCCQDARTRMTVLAQPLPSPRRRDILPNRLAKAAMTGGRRPARPRHRGAVRLYARWPRAAWASLISGNTQIDRLQPRAAGAT